MTAGQAVLTGADGPPVDRKRSIEIELLRLGQRGTASRRLVRRALRLLDLPARQLTAVQKEQLDLLDRLVGKGVTEEEFSATWERLEKGDIQVTDLWLAVRAAGATTVGTVTVWQRLVAAVGELRRCATSAWARGLEGRLWIVILLTAIFTANLVETAAETWVKEVSPATGAVLTSWGDDLAWASARFERGLSFLHHDVAGKLTYYSYSVSYFFIFPVLCLAVALALACRKEVSPFRVYAFALTADYLVSLPFFFLFPIPERWAVPDSGAILLSDLWSSHLIDALRPMSGLDNCFPSFHVSMTVIAILVAYRFRLRLRVAALGLGSTVVLSTLVLGIHWIADMIAGAAVAWLSVALAVYLDARMKRRRLATSTTGC